MQHAVAVGADDGEIVECRLALTDVGERGAVMALDEALPELAVAHGVFEIAAFASEPSCEFEDSRLLCASETRVALAEAVGAIPQAPLSPAHGIAVGKQLLELGVHAEPL